LTIDELKPENNAPTDPGETSGPARSDSSIINHQSPITNHRIRLRGAWETTSTADRTHHARKFGRPRTLDARERVWLVCESVPGPVEVSVNGQPVGTLAAAGPFAADITEQLRERNAVLFAVASDRPLGEVRIEIRAATN
jgi:hypothetical protein